MSVIICGPHRHVTGLLTSKEPNNAPLLTWDRFNFELTSYYPVTTDGKTVYHKKRIDFENCQEINIRITAGDVVTISGKTFDGDEFDSAVKKCQISLETQIPEWLTNGSIEIIDDN